MNANMSIEKIRKNLEPFMDSVDFEKYKFVYSHYIKQECIRNIAKEHGMKITEIKPKINEELQELEKVLETLEYEIDGSNEITIKSLIRRLELSGRAENVLHKYKIYRIEDFKRFSLGDLVMMRSMGRETLKEIIVKLNNNGFNPKELLQEEREGSLIPLFFQTYTIENLLEGK